MTSRASLERVELVLDLDEALRLAPFGREPDLPGLRALAARRLALPAERLASLRVARRSLDTRKGRPPRMVLLLEVPSGVPPAGAGNASAPAPAARPPLHALVVGAGPAGTFAALRLVEGGARVTLIELGKPVQPRRRDLADLAARGRLDESSNYCFGEGGAGTFSDGKLYTRTKDREAVDRVLRTLVVHGADPSILVDARPHVGSNRLPGILVALRDDLARRGVEYVWSDPLVDFLVVGGAVRGGRLGSGREIAADAVVLATGHSARGIYELCAARGVALVPKAFAVGARVEHPQPLIDEIQYGRAAGHPALPAAFYHVTAAVGRPAGESGSPRGAYSFCMCPGGWIVNSATEAGGVAVNGMSLKRRDSPFANSALVVTVEPEDFTREAGIRPGALAGIELQRACERRAFALGGGGYHAPAQRLTDVVGGRASADVGPSSYRPGVIAGDVLAALPAFLREPLRQAVRAFDRTMRGFLTAEAHLVGVETRTSSPVRIVRDGATLASPSHPGLYPCGEGAGHAGGIVSAAIDGLRVAEAILVRGEAG